MGWRPVARRGVPPAGARRRLILGQGPQRRSDRPRSRPGGPHRTLHGEAPPQGDRHADAPSGRHQPRREVGERGQHERPLRPRTSAAHPATGRPCASGRRSATPRSGARGWRWRPNTSRSRSSSRGPQRRRWRRPASRSSALSRSSEGQGAPWRRRSSTRTSTATAALWKSGWSSTPTGSGQHTAATPRAPGRRGSDASRRTAHASVAGASPRLAPRPRYARTSGTGDCLPSGMVAQVAVDRRTTGRTS